MYNGFCKMLYLSLSSLIKIRRYKILFIFYVIVLFVSKDFVLEVLRIRHVNLLENLPQNTPLPERELLQLHVIFKHGHRAPFRIYPNDPNPAELWEEGLGMLTKLGRLQMYTVGHHLKRRYTDFISSNPNEIETMSSEADRSLYSAYSLLAGMYPPDEEWSIGENIPWQPIQVSYVPEPEDMYLQSNPNCPLYETSKHELIDEYEKHQDEGNKFYFEFWSNHSGRKIRSADSAGDIYKTLSVERDNNYTVPEWVLLYWDKLVEFTDIGYFLHFQSRLQQRLRAGPILNLLLKRMKEKVEGKYISKKVYLYSGHGSNIAAIQCALQMYDMKHAPHAATIVAELYRERSGDSSIRFLYFNSSNPETVIENPYIFLLQGCSEFCPLWFYEDFIQDLVIEDWRKECVSEWQGISKEIIPPQFGKFMFQEKSSSSGS
ncbi:Lysosomal acid phosphatase, partial [Stegodyphus mimosarum]